MFAKPPFIHAPADSNSHDFRQDCLAWWLFTNKSAQQRADYLLEHRHLNTEAFRTRLERCQAWWMLTNLTRVQIEADLLMMDREQEAAMRAHLNNVRAEMKSLKGETP